MQASTTSNNFFGIRTWLIYGVSVVIFLSIKWLGLTFRFSDANAYWYMAQTISSGLMPYRDYFLADPPLHILWLVPVVALLRSNLLLLELIPPILEVVNAGLILWLLRRQGVVLAWLVPVVYLFSFTIMATSDYGTGLQLATLLMLVSFHFWHSKRYFWLGAFMAAACLVKVYMVAAALGVLVWFLQRKLFREIFEMALGGVVTALIVILPFLVMSWRGLVEDTFFHHFNRPAGLLKANVLGYFVLREWFYLVLVGLGVWLNRSSKYVLPLVFLLGFFLFFRDIYYAYLGSLMLYLTVFVVMFFNKWWHKSLLYRQLAQMGIILVFAFALYSTAYYWQQIQPMGKFDGAVDVAAVIQQLPKEYDLYGTHEVTPMLALLSGKRLWENYIDTNTQTFASGAQDKELISRLAASEGVYLVTKALQNPLTEEWVPVFEGYFSTQVFETACLEVEGVLEVQSCEQQCVMVFECNE
jgi:hypothetical protein